MHAIPSTHAIILATWLAAGCKDEDSAGSPDTGEALPLEDLFSFVVLADPHITSSEEHEQRLETAVAWINDNAAERGIELVLLVGDICWSGGQETARQLLDQLEIPYLPVIGDNEVQTEGEEAFAQAFESHYALLATQLDGWSKAPTPVWNPEHKKDSWLQNFSFDHRGLHFVCLDWGTRTIASVLGETADLHDFEGGSWPWFQQDVQAAATGRHERIVMASHHPMFLTPGGFDVDEMAVVEALTGPLGPYIYADFAGHYHINHETTVEDGGYEVYITDATHDDDNTLRVVQVLSNANRFAYQQELVVLP